MSRENFEAITNNYFYTTQFLRKFFVLSTTGIIVLTIKRAHLLGDFINRIPIECKLLHNSLTHKDEPNTSHLMLFLVPLNV